MDGGGRVALAISEIGLVPAGVPGPRNHGECFVGSVGHA